MCLSYDEGRGTVIYSYRNIAQTQAKQTVHAKRTRQTRARSGPLRAAAGRIKHSPSSSCERAQRLSLATVVRNGHANYEQHVKRRRAQGFWRRRPGWLCVEGVFCLAWPGLISLARVSLVYRAQAHKQLARRRRKPVPDYRCCAAGILRAARPREKKKREQREFGTRLIGAKGARRR